MKNIDFKKIEIVSDPVETEKFKRKFLKIPEVDGRHGLIKYPRVIDKHFKFLEKRVKHVFNKLDEKLKLPDIEFLYGLIKTLNNGIEYTNLDEILDRMIADKEIKLISNTRATKLSLDQYEKTKKKISIDRISLTTYFNKFCRLNIENPEETNRKKRFYSINAFIIKEITTENFRYNVKKPRGKYLVNQEAINGYFGVGVVEFVHILKGRLDEKSIKDIVRNYPIIENKFKDFDSSIKKMEKINNEIYEENIQDDEMTLNENNKIISHKEVETKMKELSKYFNKQRKQYHKYRKIYDDCFKIPEGWKKFQTKYTLNMEN